MDLQVQESPLTKEILFNIFGSLNQEDRKSCFLVSKLWRLVGFNDAFGWQTIAQVSYSSFEKIKRGVVEITNVEIESMPFQAQNHYAKFKVKNGTDVGMTIFGGDVLQHWNELSAHPKLWFFKLEGEPDVYQLTLQLNIRHLERLFAAGEPIPGLQLILDYFPRIYVSHFKDQLKKKLTEVHTKAGIALLNQPPHLTHGSKLSQYQLEAVSWMKSIEEAGPSTFTYSSLMRLPTMPCSILFDLKSKKLISENDATNYLVTETPNVGGILADDRQLGKTLEILGLILAHPSTTKIELDKPAYTIEDLNTLPLERLLFPTNATLVVCPDYANAKHWVNEIATYVTSDIKVVCLLSEVAWNKTIYKDLAEADIVVVSMGLILHNLYQYKCTVDVDQPFPNAKYRLLTGEIPIRQLKAVHLDPERGMYNKAPLIRHFWWHRMIVDEGQAILGSESCIALLFSKYRWFVSSAPMPAKTAQFSGLLSFFKLRKCTIPLVSVFKHFTQNLVWRNTRESVKNEHEISVETNHQVAFFDYSHNEEEMIARAPFSAEYVKALRFPISEMPHPRHEPEYEEHAKDFFTPITDLTKKERYVDAKITLLTMDEKDENELLQDLKERGIHFTTTKKKKMKALLQSKLQDEIEQYEKNELQTNGHNHTTHNSTKRKAVEIDSFELGTKKPKIETLVAGPNGTNASAKETGFGTYLEEKYGTKIAFLLNHILRPMWKQDPKTRFLIFSCHQVMLEYVDQVLESFGVSAIRTFGLHKEVIRDRIRQAHARSSTRIALLLFGHTVPQIKPFGATHVIFLEPIIDISHNTYIGRVIPEDIEQMAISHVYLRGRKVEIPIIRLIARNSLEHAYAIRIRKDLAVSHTFSQEFIDTVVDRHLHVHTGQQIVYAKSAKSEHANGRNWEGSESGSNGRLSSFGGFGSLASSGRFGSYDHNGSNGNGNSRSFGNYDSDED